MAASRVNSAADRATAAARDIGDLERAHAALLESDARLRLLSQLAPVGIMQTDLGKVTTFVNDRWCELAGMTPQEASLDELEAKLVAFWLINRQRDSLELLADFMEAMPKADLHVVRNGYFGDEGKFELYNGSDIRKSVEGRGGQSVTLPDLADRVADDIYSQRLTLSHAAKALPIGNRAELGRWRGEVRKMLARVLS